MVAVSVTFSDLEPRFQVTPLFDAEYLKKRYDIQRVTVKY